MSDILVTTEGTLGHIQLNRPKALNALSLAMVETIATALTRFANDPAIAAVLISGAGERGLCAGGDIRVLYDHKGDDAVFGMGYFQAEYRMNEQIAAFSKPYIAFMDGITMGGGVGVSAHGRVRLVTERTRLAMPETGIGFFPDIGASWLLSRAPGELGTYMALCGQTITGADAILAKFADHLVASAQLPVLRQKLASLSIHTTLAEINALVNEVALPRTAPLAAHLDEINRCFRFDSVEEILAALADSGSEFAQETASIIQQKSPLSLKVTLRMIRLGRQSESLRTCLQREYAACRHVLKSNDFYEGVRAAVIDKDRDPHWHPKNLADVSDAMVEAYFQPDSPKLF